MNQTHLTLVLVGLLVVAGAGAPAAVGSAVAQSGDDTASDSDQTVLDRLLGYEPSNKTDPGPPGFVAGLVSNVPVVGDLGAGFVGGIGNPLDDPVRNASQCAADIQTELNAHNSSYETYLNDRVDATEGRDVVKVTCSQKTGGVFSSEWERASVYVVADVVNGNYTNLTVVDSTARTVDHTVVLEGDATETLPDDLANFTENYAKPNENPPQSYRDRMKGKYAGDVYGTFSFLPKIPEKHQ